MISCFTDNNQIVDWGDKEGQDHREGRDAMCWLLAEIGNYFISATCGLLVKRSSFFFWKILKQTPYGDNNGAQHGTRAKWRAVEHVVPVCCRHLLSSRVLFSSCRRLIQGYKNKVSVLWQTAMYIARLRARLGSAPVFHDVLHHQVYHLDICIVQHHYNL